ncbi:hypothetical protein LVJ85_07540 [Neisseria sp. Dent CA1/247]|uniref:hypothetical protein n=1 Tax=Neisseria sp. Dent CA1/247 TaxID=2912675 RepID=UPI001FD5681A|nr:hypothetical protein [Neisseria sp. Dent CA1/247]UOO75905.1 hypothetical protein LVJ85_07540 [Neisseria sp. Dent CA1/247]
MNQIMRTNIIGAAQYAMEAHKSALVSFISFISSNRGNEHNIEHIGTGFFYTSETGINLLITANHVIEQLLKSPNPYCSILLGDNKLGNSEFYLYSVFKLKFHMDSRTDIAYCIVDENFLREIDIAIFSSRDRSILRRPKSFRSTIVDGGKIEDEYIFGFHASNNIRKLNFQGYKRNSSKYQIRRIHDVSKDVSVLTSIKNPIFLYFDRKDMLSVNDDDFIKTKFQITRQHFTKIGNSPDWAGMSGSPYINVYTTENDQLYLRVSGILVEHLYAPPANGRYLVASPLENIVNS